MLELIIHYLRTRQRISGDENYLPLLVGGGGGGAQLPFLLGSRVGTLAERGTDADGLLRTFGGCGDLPLDIYNIHV